MTEPCTARIKNHHDDEHCVLEAGHKDPEYGTDHAGPDHPATAARKFAGEMRAFCSPHAVAADYADRLEAAMDRAKEGS